MHITSIGLCLAIAAAATLARPCAVHAAETQMRVYIGTSTGGKSESKGIYLATLDLARGEISPPALAAEARHPSFLSLHPDGRMLYACSEVSDMRAAGAGEKGPGEKKTGGVGAFAIDSKNGALSPINVESSGGIGPCFVECDAAGRFVVTANYGGGSVALLPIDAAGKLAPAASFFQHEGTGPNEKRQEKAHAHQIRIDPGGKFALSADLGTDEIRVYRIDGAAMSPNDPPAARTAPGAGPRHLAFANVAGGRFVYVLTELANTVQVFAWDDSAGKLADVQTISTLPAGFQETSYAAEIVVSPDGKFVYASNRGHDSIAIFAIDPATGKLEARGHASTGGKTPRNFAIEPTGTFLVAANQGSSTLVLLKIDASTGQLTQAGEAVSVPSPTCVKFLRVNE